MVGARARNSSGPRCPSAKPFQALSASRARCASRVWPRSARGAAVACLRP